MVQCFSIYIEKQTGNPLRTCLYLYVIVFRRETGALRHDGVCT